MKYLFATLSSDKEESNRLIYDIVRKRDEEIESMVIFYTPESKKTIARVKEDIERVFGIRVDEVEIDAFDIIKSTVAINRYLKGVKNPILFNITLGTVPMTLSGVIASLYRRDIRILYYDMDKREFDLTGILKCVAEPPTIIDIIRIIAENDEVSYTEIEKKTGLSKASVSKYINKLIDYRLVDIRRQGYGGKTFVRLSETGKIFSDI